MDQALLQPPPPQVWGRLHIFRASSCRWSRSNWSAPGSWRAIRGRRASPPSPGHDGALLPYAYSVGICSKALQQMLQSLLQINSLKRPSAAPSRPAIQWDPAPLTVKSLRSYYKMFTKTAWGALRADKSVQTARPSVLAVLIQIKCRYGCLVPSNPNDPAPSIIEVVPCLPRAYVDGGYRGRHPLFVPAMPPNHHSRRPAER